MGLLAEGGLLVAVTAAGSGWSFTPEEGFWQLLPDLPHSPPS
jgi:hypothetical protein